MKTVVSVSIMILILLFSPHIFARQGSTSEKGVQWSQQLTWEGIKQKANVENKYIILDCFATWCGPCKKMDREVFSDSRVGKILNDKFIPVKLQMDRTKKDDTIVRRWYSLADAIAKDYNVVSYPTYIILNPKGELVEKASGYRHVNRFLSVIQGALVPGKLYEDPYPIFHAYMDRFRNGEREYSQMAAMFWVAKKAKEMDAATELANAYYNYLKSLPEDSLYTKGNIAFIAEILDSKKRYLMMFFPNGRKVDSSMDIPGFSRYVVDSLIQREIMAKYITIIGKNVEPDWDFLRDTISKAYTPAFAKQNVLFGKLQWHHLEALTNRSYNRWEEYKRLFFQYLTEYGDTPFYACGTRYGKAGFLNNFAWKALFLQRASEQELRNILPFFSEGLEETRIFRGYYAVFPVDTYANLLYKYAMSYCSDGCQDVLVGEALHWQELAMALYYEDEYKVRAEQMKKREPTWTK